MNLINAVAQTTDIKEALCGQISDDNISPQPHRNRLHGRGLISETVVSNISLSGSASTLMNRFLLVALLVSSTCSAQEPDEQWNLVPVPKAFRNVPKGKLAPINGFSWYRCLVKLPADWKSDKITLNVEALDDARATYFNGINVGATGTFPSKYRSGLGEPSAYRIPESARQTSQQKTPGLHTIAIRVYQNDPRPNFSVAPPVLFNAAKQQGIRLDGQWQYRPGDYSEWATASAADFNIPTPLNLQSSDIEGIFHAVDQVTDAERYITKRQDDDNPLSPQQAERSFEVPDNLEMKLVLSEPHVTQPLFMTWDSAGRMWVMEYRQYPEVAGVKMLSRDVYLRSTYDSVPKPPPFGAKGRDRISIHEDVDGDGVYDKHKTFVDGLNIASSFAIGRNGVFVTNPPYLLFYPDRNQDDVPDAAPEVLLEGFGLEDSHSVINSLRFGPDGWLYGCQGSTVTARVKRPNSTQPAIQTMGQQIWRYHPESRQFEVFAEGGGNTFGCEIDSKGNIFSGHNGGDTRGFHYVQGGYYKKGFGKHGPLSNPFAFGYFSSMKHAAVARFTHNFIIYEDQALPKEYHGTLFGIEPLQGQVVNSLIQPSQSSFETQDISRVVKTNDQWFRPVDIKVGPDSSIYIADMYEQRIDHSSHYAGRIDRTSGRIYKLQSKNAAKNHAATPSRTNFASLTIQSLIESLKSESRTNRQTIQRILADRKDVSIAPELIRLIHESPPQTALEMLWALHSCDGLTDSVAPELLQHSDQHVRAWTIRLLCDDHSVSSDIASLLASVAITDPAILVRKQLASSAKRIPAEAALPIIRNLLLHDEDSQDIHQPLLLWWALESKATGNNRRLILETIFADDETWKRPLVVDHLAERLMKRYAISGSRTDLLDAANLLNASPNRLITDKLLKGFEDAYKGRSLSAIPDQLVKALAKTGAGSVGLRLRQGQPAAIAEAVKTIRKPNGRLVDRLQYIQILGETKRPEFVNLLLQVITTDKNPDIVSAALNSLQAYSKPKIGEAVVDSFGRLPSTSQAAAFALLSSRAQWSRQLLQAIDQGSLKQTNVSSATIRRMQLHDDSQINDLIAIRWGPISGANTQQMKDRIQQLASLLSTGSGNPKRGKPLYMKNCGQCHVLFGEGGQVGPDLTSFQRDDIKRALTNVVNPSLEIRKGFESHVVVTVDGRVITGFLADQDNQVVVLRSVEGQNVILQKDDIDEMTVGKRSIMPEGTLKSLSDQDIRDLFAYFRSSQPVNY